MQRTELGKNVIWNKLHGQEDPSMNRLCGRAIIGYMPEIGRGVTLEGREGDVGIHTSKVTGIEELKFGLLVRTLNSVYFLEWDEGFRLGATRKF